MKWLLKLFGYKYKLIVYKTDWHSSEFNRTIVCKVPIDYNPVKEKLWLQIKMPIFSYIDEDSIFEIHQKNPNGNYKIHIDYDYWMYGRGSEIVSTFNNHYK